MTNEERGAAATIPFVHMAAWDTDRAAPESTITPSRSRGPLRSAVHPAWWRNPQGTNIPTGPLSDGWSAVEVINKSYNPMASSFTLFG